MKKYWGSWGKAAGILKDFEEPAEVLAGAEVLAAAYEQEAYEGAAYVLFLKDGKLYGVYGGHCSCNGLEKQRAPEEVTVLRG